MLAAPSTENQTTIAISRIIPVSARNNLTCSLHVDGEQVGWKALKELVIHRAGIGTGGGSWRRLKRSRHCSQPVAITRAGDSRYDQIPARELVALVPVSHRRRTSRGAADCRATRSAA